MSTRRRGRGRGCFAQRRLQRQADRDRAGVLHRRTARRFMSLAAWRSRSGLDPWLTRQGHASAPEQDCNVFNFFAATSKGMRSSGAHGQPTFRSRSTAAWSARHVVPPAQRAQKTQHDRPPCRSTAGDAALGRGLHGTGGRKRLMAKAMPLVVPLSALGGDGFSATNRTERVRTSPTRTLAFSNLAADYVRSSAARDASTDAAHMRRRRLIKQLVWG
jgi:hypothetical protein